MLIIRYGCPDFEAQHKIFFYSRVHTVTVVKHNNMLYNVQHTLLLQIRLEFFQKKKECLSD